VDRHLAKYKNKAAIIWVPEPEDEAVQTVTYQELYKRVNEFALVLKEFAGLKTGDRVTFHLPMIPELPISMLAAAVLASFTMRSSEGSAPRPALNEWRTRRATS